MNLAEVLIGNPDDKSRVPTLRAGVVTATSPLTVQVGAAETATACNAIIPAAFGDVVSVLVVDGDRLMLGPIATEWADVTFNTGWSNFDATGSPPNRNVQYRRVGDTVELRGVAKPTAAVPATTSATIFTLPAGFRPTYLDVTFPVNIDGSAKVVSVSNGGVVAVYSGSTVGAAGFVFLDPVRFPVS